MVVVAHNAHEDVQWKGTSTMRRISLDQQFAGAFLEGPKGVLCRFERWTPHRSDYVLEHYNQINRHIKPNKIASQTADMLAGEWHEDNSATISFDGPPPEIHSDRKHPQMLDGQNRLTSISRSGVAQTLLTVYCVSRAAQRVMDQGAPRTLTDTLALEGESNVHLLAGAIRALWMMRRHNAIRNSTNASPIQLYGLWKDELGLTDFTSHGTRVSSALHFGFPAVLTTLLYLFDEADPEYAPEFRDALLVGEGLRDYNRQLRAFLDKPPHLHPDRVSSSAVLIKAFDYMRMDYDVTYLRYRRSSPAAERFPRILTREDIDNGLKP